MRGLVVRCTLLRARIGRIGAFGRGGGRTLCAKISHGKGQPLPTIFGVVSKRAELSR